MPWKRWFVVLASAAAVAACGSSTSGGGNENTNAGNGNQNTNAGNGNQNANANANTNQNTNQNGNTNANTNQNDNTNANTNANANANNNNSNTAPPPAQHALRITITGPGAVDVSGDATQHCDAACTVTANAGASLALSATPGSDATFSGWSGACSGTSGCTVKLDADTDVTATFAASPPPPPPPPPLPPPPTTHALRVAITGPGAVDVSGDATQHCDASCTVTANAGASLKLTATAGSGATFSGWSGACSGTSGCDVKLDADADVTATFAATPPPPPTTHVLRVAITGPGAVDVSGDASQHCDASCTVTANAGATLKLTATAGSGATFSGWSGACSGTGACNVALGADTDVTAAFAMAGGYDVKALTAPGGTLFGVAIDARGDVFGTFSADECCTSQVFLYDAATDAVTFPLPDHHDAYAYAMNDVGMLVLSDQGTYYRYAGGTLTPVSPGLTPAAVNDAGWIAGWATFGAGPLHAALDDGSGVRDLDPAHPDVASTASGINASGAVVGSWLSSAVVFEAGGPRKLDVPLASTASDVSDGGVVVGSAGRTFKWPKQAFLANLAGGAVTLVDPPAPDPGLWFTRVSRSGAIAIGGGGGTGQSDPVVYRDGHLSRLSDLATLPQGWMWTSATDVNDRGQILAQTRDLGGKTRTVILTPR